jgi:hypothetical protein
MRTKLFLTGIAALLLATGAAHTETNVRGCFVRVYDKAHLAKHPDQIVTTAKLHIKEPDPDPDLFICAKDLFVGANDGPLAPLHCWLICFLRIT